MGQLTSFAARHIQQPQSVIFLLFFRIDMADAIDDSTAIRRKSGGLQKSQTKQIIRFHPALARFVAHDVSSIR